MRSNSVQSFMPLFYDNVLEMSIIANTQDNVLNVLEDDLELLMDRQFAKRTDEEGVAYYESLLGIVPDTTTETLTFRRSRLLNRLSLTAPFSMAFLRSVLDNTIGVNRWEAHINYDEYTLYVESSAADQQWFAELVRVINMIKPANIAFVNVPLSALNLAIKESILYTKNTYMYNLGTTFRLGMNTFMGETMGGNVKLDNARSLEQPLFTSVAAHVKSRIGSVVINNTLTITDFDVLESSGSVVNLTYFVNNEDVSSITNIKIKDTSNNVISNVNVYVPVVEEVSMKHTITVKEL